LGMNFSLRKLMQPLPPSPALTQIFALSINILHLLFSILHFLFNGRKYVLRLSDDFQNSEAPQFYSRGFLRRRVNWKSKIVNVLDDVDFSALETHLSVRRSEQCVVLAHPHV
jgi:hypothetical protein